MQKRHAVLPCKKRVPSLSSAGIEWYGMVGEDINGFLACKACYEDLVVSTAFESKFGPYRKQPFGDKWTCDASLPSIRASLIETSKVDAWSAFIEAALQRLRLPACEEIRVQSNTRNWFLPRNRIPNFHICEACYQDNLAFTEFKDDFERHIPATGFDAFMEQLGELWTCGLAKNNYPMAYAVETALKQHDLEVLWGAADAISRLVTCTQHGIIRGNWWTVDGCKDVSICEACYEGVLKTTGVDRFFESAERDRKATIICSFNAAIPRSTQFLNMLAKSIDLEVFSYFREYVTKWATVPFCPGIKPRDKTSWWGYPEVLVCQDCYLGFVADTSLGDAVQHKEVYDERPLCCQVWSPRMRKMWLDTCAAGEAGSTESEAALKELREFSEKRMTVYGATIPQITMIRGMKEMTMMNAMSLGMRGLMYQGANSMASIPGNKDGYLHGSSSLGWHETEYGATSAQMFQGMQSGIADASRMDDWTRLAHLTAMWNEVE